MPPFASRTTTGAYPPIPAAGDPRIRPSVMDRPGATPASDGRTGGTISDPQPARVEAGVETTGVGIVSSVLDMQRAFFRMVSNLLLNSDSAWWENRRLQRQMRNDPDIMSPLLQRQYAVALLEWNIVAEDEEDELQVEQAKHLKRVFDRMRRKHEFIKALQEAIWYGPSMVNCIYRPGPMGFTPEKWFPIHPDSVTFDAVGNVGLLVGPDYKGATVPGHIGRVHMLTELERKACVLHTFNHQAPDYEMPNESRYLFSGRGLREICFKFWLFKQIALQNWMKWVERYSLGIRVGTYPDGNDEAKAEMQQSLHNIVSDVSVVIPRIAGQTKDQNPYSIEILDLAGGEGQKGLVTLIEGYLAGQLKELIIGQTATTEPTVGGLGEGTSTRHAETFQRIIDMDAKALADTLTFDFIEPLHILNFGDTPYRPRVEAVIEKVDSEEFLAGVQAFVGMGGAVPERQVRSQLGIDEPRDDEPVLGGPQDLFGPDGMGGGPDGGGGGPDGGGGGGGVEAFSRFRRGFVSMFGVSGGAWDESKHPRGQPENAGQFGPGGGGASNPVAAMAAKEVVERKKAAAGKEKKVAKAKATVEKQVAAAGSHPDAPEHAKHIKVPPGWTNVKFSSDPNAALLVTGVDAKGRRTAIYSTAHATKQAAAKFARIKELMRKEEYIRRENDGALKGPRSEEAAVVKLLFATGIRPGSDRDTKADKKAYGATTLQGRHVHRDAKGNVSLRFVGKKGVDLNIPVRDREVADMLVDRSKRSGKDGKLFNTNDTRLREYVATLDGGKFKPKDLRTLLGTKSASEHMKNVPEPANEKEYKKRVKEVATHVSSLLGNTPTIALQSYIAPEVFASWQSKIQK